MQFQISSRREIAKELPESSRYEFLAKFLANIFALSDAKENTLGPLNWKATADLPLLRTLYCQFTKSLQSQVSGKW